MTVPRITIITLGVGDLQKSTSFYEAIFGIHPNPDYEGISFFELPGTWLTLYPLEKLAEDISPQLPASRGPFSGVTLAYNASSKEDVVAIFDQAKAAGASVVKPPQDTFWGGFSGYFADLDGYYWEVAWGPMFDHAPDGSLRFAGNGTGTGFHPYQA
ncbi:MAG TPA: VOC family protein [Anaerolineae bacterium]|jgi:catechol 2,3-dioxygenase-like lactoylglutathione lyase family enzyme|nr:VOC family protein [Anaerolineae bacterium]